MSIYCLDDETHEIRPIELEDLWRTGEQVGKSVAKTKVGDVEVSTVFLSIDHSFGGGRPLVFETMVFGGEHDQWQDRYSTWDEAVKGHENAVKMVKGEKTDHRGRSR